MKKSGAGGTGGSVGDGKSPSPPAWSAIQRRCSSATNCVGDCPARTSVSRLWLRKKQVRLSGCGSCSTSHSRLSLTDRRLRFVRRKKKRLSQSGKLQPISSRLRWRSSPRNAVGTWLPLEMMLCAYSSTSSSWIANIGVERDLPNKYSNCTSPARCIQSMGKSFCSPVGRLGECTISLTAQRRRSARAIPSSGVSVTSRRKSAICAICFSAVGRSAAFGVLRSRISSCTSA